MQKLAPVIGYEEKKRERGREREREGERRVDRATCRTAVKLFQLSLSNSGIEQSKKRCSSGRLITRLLVPFQGILFPHLFTDIFYITRILTNYIYLSWIMCLTERDNL